MDADTYPRQPDGSVLIGNKKYRTGFLYADWHEGQGEDEQLSDSRNRLMVRREKVLFFGGRIYHYTTISGFKGIIDTNGFWASDNRFMNDAEELYHGFELIKEVVEQRMRRELDFKHILAAVLSTLPKPHENPRLVACFSLARDSLEQWRGYGPSGGICIGLGGARTDDVAPISVGPDLLLHKVIYGRRAKLTHIISIIRRFKRQYQLDRRAMDDWPQDHDQNYTERLGHALAHASVLFKNEAFHSEQEIRYVVSPAHADRFDGGVEFRASSVGLIPYVNTAGYGPPSKRLPIFEVTVGPSPHQEVIASSVKTFLLARGYKNPQVNISRVPFRSI
ncbi:DUF2971 domain-containing protein [Chelatococcus asaccharovorans]|uniref:DUF2971 domain-containing protein n=1 Tax=Chelatococcus asaccharovorans TaxID=28210 RepID=UPI002264A628|nr:DUF2971 domain-containing protein [Chelatococcus asaccharovorans]